MSEPIQDRPTLPDDNDSAGPRQGNHRLFAIVAISALAGLLLGGTYLLLKPAGAESTDTLVTATATDTTGADDSQTTTEPEPSPSPTAGAAVSRTSVRLTSRDPFQPLVSSSAPTAAATKKAKKTVTATTATTKTGGTISALKITAAGDAASLKLDGKRYTVDEGETFAKVYRLYDIFNDSCAGFLYGDQNSVVCEGDTVQMG